MNTDKAIIVCGCGYEGEAGYWNGRGKLAWKCEFAARWAALQIVFEAAGKDIADSVRVNDRVCREVLGWEPPLHMIYEMFLEKGGKKISKSKGGVFTPQDWLRYGSPESLRLLMLKRFTGTRELSPDDIPVYMEEVDRLEKIYSGEEKIENEKEQAHLKRLFEYVHFLELPKLPTLKVSYQTLVNIARMLPVEPERKFGIIKESLNGMGLIPKGMDEEKEDELKRRMGYANAWIETHEPTAKPVKIKLSSAQKAALKDFVKLLERDVSGEEIQTSIFEVARAHGLKTAELFKLIYKILLGEERGPRAGPLVEAIGKKKVAELIEHTLE